LHKKNYGGKRKGAGWKRPRTKVSYTLYLLPSTKKYIKDSGGSAWIEKIVKENQK